MKQTRQRDIIACSQRAIIIHQEFGYDKQRNTFNAFYSAFHASKHQMHDILIQFVVTSRDPYLVTGYAVGAVFSRNSIGGQV